MTSDLMLSRCMVMYHLGGCSQAFTTDAVLMGISTWSQGHTNCVLCLVHNTTQISSDHFLQEKTQQVLLLLSDTSNVVGNHTIGNIY